MGKDDIILDELKNKEYEAGFVTDIEMDVFPKGLNEDVIRAISKKKAASRIYCKNYICYI